MSCGKLEIGWDGWQGKVRQAAGRTLAESKHALAIILWNCLGTAFTAGPLELGAGRLDKTFNFGLIV
jgi:hypothetical protein